MRLSMLGCVLKRLLIMFVNSLVKAFGRAMKSCATSSLSTCPRPGSSLILRSAEASANGLPQSSAPPASAMYSRLRLMAKRVSNVKK